MKQRFASHLPSTVVSVEVRHLRAFLALAEELNFTRAAARLHLAQQALSAQIRQLELLVGTTLFTRTTRRVELTAAGHALLERAPGLLEGLEDPNKPRELLLPPPPLTPVAFWVICWAFCRAEFISSTSD